MSSNGNVGSTSLINKIIESNSKYYADRLDDSSLKKEHIKVLEEGLKEILENLYSLKVTIENKIIV